MVQWTYRIASKKGHLIRKYCFLIAALLPNVAFAEVDFGSLEALRDLEVTTVSKKEESSLEAAAAVYVLSGDDIRRSGAVNIPEALREVPGLNVARIDSNRWAISARGFNREFANKLLVLLDGRSVYTPLFSGTFWDSLNVPLSDIERIEVVRGPGASLWGANAVNGVINIITKNARSTGGNRLSFATGSLEDAIAEFRHGGQINETYHYRISGKHAVSDQTDLANGLGANDRSMHSRVDGRLDWEVNNNEYTLLLGANSGDNDRIFNLPANANRVRGEEDYSGANMLFRWDQNGVDTGSQLQAYIDYTSRNTEYLLEQENVTFDMDWQKHHALLDSRLEFMWGLGYRYFVDNLHSKAASGVTHLGYTPDRTHNNSYSAFLQAKYALIPNKVDIILGSKFEHNFYTDFEYQPTVRISYQPDVRQTLWASVSRAIRVPSRGERTINLVDSAVAPNVYLRVIGSDAVKAEDMLAYELGYRFQPIDWLSLDVASYLNEYNNLRSFEPNGSFSVPIANKLNATVRGIEIASRLNIGFDTLLQINYAISDTDFSKDAGSTDPVSVASQEGISPNQTAAFLIRHNLNEDMDLNLNSYYVDALDSGVNDYLKLDMGLSYRPINGVEISLVGQNLAAESQQQFSEAFFSQPSQMPRAFYLKTSIDF